jgi:PAS domain S-box-containing protein
MLFVRRRLLIFHQLFLLTGFLVMGVSFSLGILFFGQMKKIVVDERKARLDILAQNLADNARKGLETQNVFHSLNPLVDALLKQRDMAFIHILDANGKVLVSSRLPLGSIPPVSASTPDVLEEDRQVLSDQPTLGGQSQSVATAEGNRYRIGTVHVGLSLGSFKRQLVQAQVLTFLLAGGIFAVGILLASLLAQWLAGRVKRLTQAAQAIGRGDYTTQIQAGFNDELGDLATTLNQMSSDIQKGIAESQQAHLTMQESEEKYRQLFAAETDAVIVFDIESRKATEVNDAAQKLYGYNRDEFRSLFVSDISAEKDKTENLFKNLNLGAPGEVIRRLHRKKDGTAFPVEIHFGTTLLARRWTMISSIRDLTGQERLQAAMIQSEKMAGIGQFSAGVAHDVNNPVGVILGFAQGLIRRITETDPLMLPYKSIEREALRCKTLVQNLLAFSRGQGNTAVMKPEDLSLVIENALVLVTTLARPKKVNLVNLPREALPPVSIDSNQIQQVVINLCTNAIDAMPSGGTLTVGVANKGDHAEISVQDTGSGIPPEVRDRMFEAFFTTKEVGKGTGLGLSIITNIVKTHHGKIDVQSEVGKGTTFTIQLPLSADTLHQKTSLAA